MNAPILQVKNLKVSFRQSTKTIYAVRGVSFELYPKQMLAIVGESGSGKSVMVKSLLKLFSSPSLSIDEGEVLYQNQNILSLPEKKIRSIRGCQIGMIFQDPMNSLNPTMTIGRQILENILQHDSHISYKAAYEKTLTLLTLVGIADPRIRFSQYPHELSGGLRQRVMIAIALAPSPKILIADEPTTALDVTVQAQILQLLKKIQESLETSIILITHDLSIVAGFCDHVLVMYGGKIVETAPVVDIFYKPQHPYTKKLLESIPRLNQSKAHLLTPIPGAPPDLSIAISGCSFAPRCPYKLKICTQHEPPFFAHDLHSHSACWHHDPRVAKEAL